MSAELIVAVGLGVFFLIFILVIALFVPDPSAFQMFVFRVVLSVAAAGEGAVTPGFINVEFVREHLISVRAGGALALFVLVYLVNPPDIAARQSVRKRHKKLFMSAARDVVPILENIADVFDKVTGTPPPGFYAEHLRRARELAATVRDNCPADSPLRSSTALTKVAEGGVDAAAKQPYFNVSPGDLRALCHEIKPYLN